MKNMMKAVLMLSLLVTLTACGNDSKDSNHDTDTFKKEKKTNETKSQDDVESLNIKDLPKSTEMNMKKDIKIKDEQNKIIIKKDSIKYDKDKKQLSMDIIYKPHYVFEPERIGRSLTIFYTNDDNVQRVRYRYKVHGENHDHTVVKHGSDFKLEE
ncbi:MULTISPECIES: lipoprotein [Staphylococcus]|uniref:Lipoprotein n=1 Tax=Staphylococcus lugdunensis TaxID=28035 RepID=A0ABX6BYW0_STALU|nr:MULTISPECIES: hypothetical protein [Staphylococcus]ADC88045.1 hypothetical protein SLGD_01957 [Staphylococcus lugdunensis HKU09-01]AMG64944.1 hypothetical protein AL501_12030 [Staphylococcus lugdunensis]ARB78268.1 hypothetical protein A6J61_08100 [Staphylococcus lugdunensis]ARJ09789.1 hypothetical protein B7454_10425 [Staphylococcus lugdunensis]ARJ16826.1 hypothetical protein B6N54_09505 [Staphylococcus lugdunensis]